MFEPAVVALPGFRDRIVDHLFVHHTMPVNPGKLASTFGHAHGHAALRHASHSAQAPVSDTAIVARSPAAQELLRQIMRVAKVDAPVLLCVDARVIAATHVDLKKAVASGAFRKDLFYCLNVVPLRVPSLHERQADVGLLAEHLFRRSAAVPPLAAAQAPRSRRGLMPGA